MNGDVQIWPDDLQAAIDEADEYIDAWDVLDGRELGEQLRTGVTRRRRLT